MVTGESEQAGPSSEVELDRSVSVRIGRDRFRTDAAVRGHPIVVDEPAALGGSDLGPTPFDLLCTALGGCTAITLRMYADRKEWSLEEVLVKVEHRREKALEGRGGSGVDVFRMRVGLRGELDDGQRARLIEIAARCPVHRTLAAGATIETMSD
jgi:uncharacterized OsmC-like protein